MRLPAGSEVSTSQPSSSSCPQGRGKGQGIAGVGGYVGPGLNPWITGFRVGRKSHSETRVLASDPPDS